MKTNILKYIPIFWLLLWAEHPAAAQTITLQQSIELAGKNNYLLKIAGLETQSQQILIRTARELPKTNLDLQLGRTQAAFTNDYVVGLIQQFSHPGVYQAQTELQKSQVTASQRVETLRRNEIVSNLKLNYYQLFYYQQLRQTLVQQDSIYKSALQIAQARYKTGESNALERINAEVRMQEINNRLAILLKEEEAVYQSYRLLLNSGQDIRLSFEIPIKRDTMAIIQLVDVRNNPLLSVLEQQTVISQRQTDLEKQKLKPDFRVGVVNQSIERYANQIFFSGGIGIPIFTKAQKARVEASRVNEKIAESNLKHLDIQLNGQLNIFKMTYEKHRSSLQYYEGFALPQAEQLIKNAMRNYRSGEIDYVELIQSNQQAWQIKEGYLSTVLNFNQTLIQIETLLGIE